MTEEDARVESYRVPKIPPFWRQAPEDWSLRVEASFRNTNITVDSTKVDHLIVSLDPEVISHIRDLITAEPPPDNLYKALRDRILATFAVSPEARLRQLLKGQVLGDRRPSHLLSQMNQLNGGQCSPAVLRSLFIELLPDTHKAILVATNEPDLQKLAEIADKLADINGPSSAVALVAPKESKGTRPKASLSADERIDKLTKQIQSLSTSVAKLRRDRSTSRKRINTKHGDEADKPDVKAGYCFIHPNNTLIDTFGERRLTLDLGLRRPITWTFRVANVLFAILGADVLTHYKLIVNLHKRRLVDNVTSLSSSGQILAVPEIKISIISNDNKFADILSGFPEVTGRGQALSPAACAVEHHISTNGPPVAERPRRLPPDKLKAAKAEIMRLSELGICRPSSSPWASSIHLVRKGNGDWRLCGDYRRLNAVTIPDKYPIPYLHDFTSNLLGKSIFTSLDLFKAYHQIPMAKADIPKTAVITPFGLFEFVSMTFGLRNAAQTFQRYIHYALRDLNFAFAYIDDILIASSSMEEHRKHLSIVFQKLKEFGLVFNPSKCVFGVEELTFLGHRVNKFGLKPSPDKVAAIRDIPKPKTVAELRRFLGALNFYRRSLRHAARVQAPLHAYLTDSRKNDKREIQWTLEAETAFDKAKNDLANAT
ncbi:PREDICTED: uncharacterized protein LOC105564854, partial [Vollenhovia emeryi]|uniref:uncharacterized protein LOC105564854 n=1 Tax=Vollenhovia emeryi TaxID=411798 RepID=UPI0005F48DD0